jgi:quercetin dioxygenase-like cupin family protein
MHHPTLEEFTKTALADGYDSVAVRDWEANSTAELHTHDFAVRGLVTKGEMWLTRNGLTEHFGVGQSFTMEALTPHSERYGAEGTTYWAARKFLKI